MTASAAITGYLSTLQLTDGGTPPFFMPVAEIIKITGMGMKHDTVEVTNLTSLNACKEFIFALCEVSEIDIEFNYIPGDATQQDLISNIQATSGNFRKWRLVLPDFGATTATLSSITTNVLTFTGAHGWNSLQPVKFTNSGGALPTGIVEGVVYWGEADASNTLILFPTLADAYASLNQISCSGGTGTTTAKGTSVFSFPLMATIQFSMGADPAQPMRGTAKFKISGPLTAP